MLQATFFVVLLALAAASQDCPNKQGQRARSKHLYNSGSCSNSCNQLMCDKGQISSKTADGPTCVNNVFPSCTDVACPEGMRCVELHIPSRDLRVGQCYELDVADSYPTYETYTCSSGYEICERDSQICIEAFQSDNFLNIACSTIGCSDESPCPSVLLCIEAPQHLKNSFQSVCVAPSNFEFSNESCSTSKKQCSNAGSACHDLAFEGQLVGTDCGPSGTAFTATSCTELECPTFLLDECYERTIEGRGGLALCAFKNTIDNVAKEIQSLLDII